MGLFEKLFGKGNSQSRQWSVWFNDRARAKEYVDDEMKFQMLLAAQGRMGGGRVISGEEAFAISTAVAKGKYKIVPKAYDGQEGFDLVVFY